MGCYIAIDLKSFYASVECVDRGLDPLRTHLVVADESRTDKTICLAVSPALKALGIPGRPRLFEVKQQVENLNRMRKEQAPGRRFAGEAYTCQELKNPALSLGFYAAMPRMARYIEVSSKIYGIYLRYIAPEDIHVYSIDEVFMDVSGYLHTYGLTPKELAIMLMQEVLKETGITATAGVGTNLYLAKVAMDIDAKHMPPDENGARISELTEQSYRERLWNHRPLTDFWRIGHGYAKKLENQGLYTMGDIARCSLGKAGEYYNQELLYRLFGINAELLIDHAWGMENCTMQDIKQYKPGFKSVSSGQVLQEPHTFSSARLILREMAEALSLDLVEQKLLTSQLTVTVGYDRENLSDPLLRQEYTGAFTMDHYGRPVPKSAHGTVHLSSPTSSTPELREAAGELFDRIVNRQLLVRRLNITAENVLKEEEVSATYPLAEQLNLFENWETVQAEREAKNKLRQQERQRQEAALRIKKKYGKNAIFRGMDLKEGATAIARNEQIGGHRA